MRRLGAWMLAGVLVAGWTAGYAQGDAVSTDTARRAGHLIIVGGGLDLEDKWVYDRMFSLLGDEGRVGIVPTASGEPQRSGAAYVGDFTKSGRGDRVRIIDVTTSNPAAAADLEVAQSIRECRLLFFTGGDQKRIVDTFRPNGEATVSDLAFREVLSRGGIIGGSSAGAAMMSDPMIRWGNPSKALRRGVRGEEDEGVGVGLGMGFFPYGMTDQHFLSRGRLGRLIVALESSGIRFGWGVDDDKGIHVQLETGRTEALGERALLLTDMAEAKRTDEVWEGIRLSLLNDGDVVLAETGDIVPGAGRVLMGADARTEESATTTAEAWDNYTIPVLLEALARSKADFAEARDGEIAVRLIRDEETAFYDVPGAAEDAQRAITVLRMRMELRPGRVEESGRGAGRR